MDDETNVVFIPHPTIHFGTPYLSWDVIEGKKYFGVFLNSLLEEFKETQMKVGLSKNKGGTMSDDDDKEVRLLQSIMERYGLFLRNDISSKDEQQFEKNGPTPHPLSILHRNRLMETAYLFASTGWTKSSNAIRQIKTALDSATTSNQGNNYTTITNQEEKEKAFYDSHETPAPKILKEWRDSSRDMLCSLYAYATLSPNVIQKVINAVCSKDDGNANDVLLSSLAVNHIIEVGAGTGYVASLFREVGRRRKGDKQKGRNKDSKPASSLRIDAFDIALDSNEYHGNTPPFYKVSSGTSLNSMQRLLPPPSASNENNMNTALLLCYPPPLSNMAEDALHAFMSLGGRVLIHIGEFCGLTGSSAFENLLLTDFQCIHRYPCLEWGTDAAEVTIWLMMKPNEEKSRSICDPILAQCSNCPKRQATKRCKL
eukprot:4638034-Ditylum_brightwellii.AAC.1